MKHSWTCFKETLKHLGWNYRLSIDASSIFGGCSLFTQLAYLPMIGAVIVVVFTFFCGWLLLQQRQGGNYCFIYHHFVKMSQYFQTGRQQTMGKRRAKRPSGQAANQREVLNWAIKAFTTLASWNWLISCLESRPEQSLYSQLLYVIIVSPKWQEQSQHNKLIQPNTTHINHTSDMLSKKQNITHFSFT